MTYYSLLSSVNGVDLLFTRCDYSEFYVSYRNNHVILSIPTERDILNYGKKAPQTCFILFRNVIQDSVTSLNLRIERQDLSKHASNFWNQLKVADMQLIDEFKRVAKLAAKNLYSEIRIVNVNINYSVAAPVRRSIVIDAENDDEGLQDLLKDLFVEVLPTPFLHD
ncbi:hypothetical protein C2G38_2076617 [Gigaspora rosea]|uniref:Uncharacterized protein n=1 Tax=Gigaspora rosea TaxID=44941 RepID=A0A397VJQ6_9GLOM|nr:hypothetical protein C2G38_2076617 [Gigaspora rosea]